MNSLWIIYIPSSLLNVGYFAFDNAMFVSTSVRFFAFAAFQIWNSGYATINSSTDSVSFNRKTRVIASSVDKVGRYTFPLLPTPFKSLLIVDFETSHSFASIAGVIFSLFKCDSNNAVKLLLGLRSGILLSKAVPSVIYFVIVPRGPEVVCVVCKRMIWYWKIEMMCTIAATSFVKVTS